MEAGICSVGDKRRCPRTYFCLSLSTSDLRLLTSDF